MPISAARSISEPGQQVSPITPAPTPRAAFIAPRTYGVLPLAAMPTSVSFSVRASLSISSLPSSALSSAPSTALKTAPLPPAMTACTVSGETEYVGGHSRHRDAEPPGGTAAAVYKTSAALHARIYEVYGGGDLRADLLHSVGNFLVLTVDEADHLRCRQAVDIAAARLRRSVASFVISEVFIDISLFSQPFTAPIVTPSRKYF